MVICYKLGFEHVFVMDTIILVARFTTFFLPHLDLAHSRGGIVVRGYHAVAICSSFGPIAMYCQCVPSELNRAVVNQL